MSASTEELELRRIIDYFFDQYHRSVDSLSIEGMKTYSQKVLEYATRLKALGEDKEKELGYNPLFLVKR